MGLQVWKAFSDVYPELLSDWDHKVCDQELM